MTTVIGYVRVSTDEQARNGASLDGQRRAIADECERRGWELAEVVTDDGYSAKDLRRPGIQRCLEALKGGDAGVLMVAKLDRLSRSVLDFSQLMASAQGEGWAVSILDLGVDTTSPAGEAMVNVLAAFAQFERRLIGQRTRDAMAEKKRQGAKFGRPVVLADEVRARIRQEREDGATLKVIADGLNAEGVKTAHGGARWYPSTVRAVVNSQA
jgi:DNA invertase Pin-like site-specific DNA recombinase